MSAPLWLSLAVIVYGLLHSLLASARVKGWAQARLGPVAGRWYRLAYNLFALLAGLPILALYATLPDQPLYRIPLPWVGLTLLGQMAGVLIIGIGLLQVDPWHFLGLRQLLEPGGSAETPLVIAGLYRWVRHPLYTGALIFIWLFPRMSVNLLTLFIWATLYLYVGAKFEETRLVRAYGQTYREYQQRVPMLIPRLLPRNNLL